MNKMGKRHRNMKDQQEQWYRISHKTPKYVVTRNGENKKVPLLKEMHTA